MTKPSHLGRGRSLDRNDGYVRITSGPGDRMREHRFIASVAAGRKLSPDEVVHHKNGDRSDNRIENLEIKDAHRHAREHAGWVLVDNVWHKRCSRCHRMLPVETCFYRRRKTSSIPSPCCIECLAEKRTIIRRARGVLPTKSTIARCARLGDQRRRAAAETRIKEFGS